MRHRSKLAASLEISARRIRGPLLALLVGLVVPVLSPASASACSCAGGSPEARLAESRHAVIAKLVDVRKEVERQGPPVGPGSAKFVYKLKRVVKGGDHLRSKRRLKIRSSLDGASCGLPQRHPKRYGLFLYRERTGRLSANLCSVVSARSMHRAADGMDGSSRLAGSPAATCRANRA